MSQKLRFAAFALLLAASLVAFQTTPARADFAGGYTGHGAGDTSSEACAMATSAVEAHCDRHGAITTTPNCRRVLSDDGTHLEWFCLCDATTRLCLNGPF